MPFSVSIICPTFNRSPLLRECVQSVFSGANPSIEVVVADDGSTDDTQSVCRDLQKTYGSECVMVSRSQENLGAQAARNRGLRVATGDLVMFVDSDDVIVPGGVAKLVECLQQNSTLDYAYGKIIRTDEQLKPLAGILPVGVPFTDLPVEVAGYHWHTMGAVYRKNYLEKVGLWNEALTGSQDWEYQARVKLTGGWGQFVDTVVGYWREHGGGRVGTKAFRPDYVRSVMIACDSILQHARKAGRCDNALERRIAKKLILHALEWGANGHPNERNQCLSQAVRSLSDDGSLKTGIKCLQAGPAFMDGWLWSLLVKRGSGKSGKLTS